MKKKTILVLNMILLFGLIMTACTGNDADEPISQPSPPPREVAYLDEEDMPEGLDETTTPPTQAEVETENIKTQMAGNWRLEIEPGTDVLVNLFADGKWEFPKEMFGGNFDITREETGIYSLTLTVEHVSAGNRRGEDMIGSELQGVYQYDSQNDRLGTKLRDENGNLVTVWFTRE